jgi:hypothetical protein
MNDRLNPNIGRRKVLRALACGIGTAAATAPLAVTAAARSADPDKMQRARYQANSPEVQTFYRVNRYPAR